MKTKIGMMLGVFGLLTSAAAWATSPEEAKLEKPVMEEIIVVAKAPETLAEGRAHYTRAPIVIDYTVLTDKIEFTPEIHLDF